MDFHAQRKPRREGWGERESMVGLFSKFMLFHGVAVCSANGKFAILKNIGK